MVLGFRKVNPEKFIFPYKFIKFSDFQIVNDEALFQDD
jgi:hypothetical protein